MYRKKALYKKKISTTDFKPKRDMHFVVKEVKGEKNGKSRIVLTKKSPRFYHTEDDKRRMKTRKIRRKPGAPKLRSSISPGTVLILLTGRHRGKVSIEVYCIVTSVSCYVMSYVTVYGQRGHFAVAR
jgi:large subunit ribosomal protein L6e